VDVVQLLNTVSANQHLSRGPPSGDSRHAAGLTELTAYAREAEVSRWFVDVWVAPIVLKNSASRIREQYSFVPEPLGASMIQWAVYA
jgi:hypothetical protein